MSKQRIYYVDVQSDPAFPVTRLVRAQSPAQAIRHVASGMISAEVATQEAIVELITRGIRVEDASTVVPA